MTKTVLVIAAHPDDEVIGCGGTLAKHIESGDQVITLFMTDGESARTDVKLTQISARQKMAESAATILGTAPPIFLNFPDNKMDVVPLLEITQAIEQARKDMCPDVIYTHHLGDLNIDHRITAQATLTAFRPQPGSSVQEIYSFEVNSSTEWTANQLHPSFHPNVFVDIKQTWDKKLRALECYESELRQFPHSRSTSAIENLNQWRGNSVGLATAEAFSLLRLIRS